MLGLLAVGLNVVDKYTRRGLMYPGGNELNVAVYAKWLGYRSGFIGVFGSDAAARSVVSVLDRVGVDHSHSRFAEGENGYALVDIVDGERVFGYYNHGGVTGLHPIVMDEGDLSYASGFDVVSTSINAHISIEEIQKIRGIGVPVSYDFSDFFTENLLREIAPEVDYAFLSCGERTIGDIEWLLAEVWQLGCPLCVATRGAAGAITFDGVDFHRQPAVAVEVVDTMGAGDAFIAGFLLRHRMECQRGAEGGASIVSALSAAAEFASKICTIEGAIGFGTPLA